MLENRCVIGLEKRGRGTFQAGRCVVEQVLRLIFDGIGCDVGGEYVSGWRVGLCFGAFLGALVVGEQVHGVGIGEDADAIEDVFVSCEQIGEGIDGFVLFGLGLMGLLASGFLDR